MEIIFKTISNWFGKFSCCSVKENIVTRFSHSCISQEYSYGEKLFVPSGTSSCTGFLHTQPEDGMTADASVTARPRLGHKQRAERADEEAPTHGAQICLFCLILLQSSRMLCAAPSHLLDETSKCFIPTSPFLDSSTGLGWQFGPCEAGGEPECSGPQEMLTTSPADTTSQKRGRPALGGDCPQGDSPCWFSGSPQCPRHSPTVGARATKRCEHPSTPPGQCYCSAPREVSGVPS